MEMWAGKPGKLPPPKEIFLQAGEGEDSVFGVTWCQDRINEADVRYVLATDLEALREQAAPTEGVND